MSCACETVARDYPTLHAALDDARKWGTHISGFVEPSLLGAKAQELFYVYKWNSNGYRRRPLFFRYGNWHFGSEETHVRALPKDTHVFASENPRHAAGEPFSPYTFDYKGTQTVLTKVRGRWGVGQGKTRKSAASFFDAISMVKAEIDARTATENPRRKNQWSGYYRRDYFNDIRGELIERYGFTDSLVKRAFAVYREDLHDYYTHMISPFKAAQVIAEYFPG